MPGDIPPYPFSVTPQVLQFICVPVDRIVGTLSITPVAVAGSTPMKILLVEDKSAVQEMIVSVLEKTGHVVVTETNGNRAHRRYSKEGPFDLVLTDIEHRGMNGVELMHAIHKENQKQDVRIVTGWQIRPKPFTSKQLLDFIKT
jgi:PleD family two-component response regulator